MAISFVAAATASSVGSGTSITVDKPTGTADDDLVAVIVANINNATYSTLSGWVKEAETSTPDNISLAVFTKIADSEPSSWTFTQSGTGWWGWASLAFRGVDTTDPVADASTGNAYTTSDTNVRAESVTASGTYTALWLGAYIHDVGGAISANPSGFTERVDVELSDSHMRIWCGEKSFSAATGNVDLAVTNAVTYKDARMLALVPAVSIPVAALHHLTMMGAGKA